MKRFVAYECAAGLIYTASLKVCKGKCFCAPIDSFNQVASLRVCALLSFD